MQIQVYQQRIILPDEGKWLYSATANVVSDKVYLGKEADASEWSEITEEEKQAIQQAQEEEI